MRQRLVVGAIERGFGVSTILEMIGVPCETLNWRRLSPEEYAVVIVDRTPSSEEGEALDAYVAEGGALLDLGGFARVRRLPTRRRRIGTVRGDTDSPFDAVWLLDVDETLRIPAIGNALGGLAALEPHGRGWLALLPLPVERFARTHAPARRRFVSPSGPLPDEIVARRPLNGLRAALEGALIWLHHRRGLPFLHRWRFPGRHESIFCFRIDTDFAAPGELESLRATCEAHGISATWFLHVGAHEPSIEIFRRYDRHELALHGYRHRAFEEYEASWGNVNEALAVVRSIGADPVGFAAPTGRWSSGLDRALSDLGMMYSSEFTLDYDGLPFRPRSGARASRVIQVPVHPISIDSIRRAGGGDREAAEYLQFVLRRKLAHSEPVIVYHHPSDGTHEPLERLFSSVRDESLPVLTMRSFVEWWHARESSYVTAELDAASLRISARLGRNDVLLRVVRPDGRERFVGASETLNLDGDGWSERAPRPFASPGDPLAVRRRSLRSVRHSIEDIYSRMRQ